MQDSLFTKIIKGEIPCHKIYEDEKTFAFLDIHPIQEGAVLVIPKAPVDYFFDLSDEDYIALMATVKRVAKRLKQTFADKKRVGLMIEGLEVAHAHVKVFPFNTGDEFRHEPDMSAEPDNTALAELAKKLAL